MKFTLEVGQRIKSKIDFSRDWFTGAMQVFVDGQKLVLQSPYSPSTHFSFTLTRRYEFSVGEAEPHHVMLEKERPLLGACLRPHTCRVFVDGQMVHEQTGY
jgi:hypothetical protein